MKSSEKVRNDSESIRNKIKYLARNSEIVIGFENLLYIYTSTSKKEYNFEMF